MQTLETRIFPVTGMSCASCATSVESMISAQKGVEQAEVNYAAQTVKVNFHPEVVQPADFQRAVQSIGYDLIVDDAGSGEKQQESMRQHYLRLKKNFLVGLVLSSPVLILGMIFPDIPHGRAIMLALTAAVLFFAGRDFFSGAWK